MLAQGAVEMSLCSLRIASKAVDIRRALSSSNIRCKKYFSIVTEDRDVFSELNYVKQELCTFATP